MKSIFVFLIISIFTFVAGEYNCDDHPTNNLRECCKIPNHNDMEVLKEISEKNKADFKDNMFLMACKINEQYFERMKLSENGEINLDYMNKYLDERVKDNDFNKILKESYKACKTEVDDEFAQVEKKWSSHNITKENCNFKITSVTTCAAVNAFINCPTSAWTDTADCKKGKDFFQSCHKNEEAMLKYVKNMKHTM